MTRNQYTPEVRRELRQMNLLALLSSAIDRLECIRTHAKNESSWMQVFLESDQAIDELEAAQKQESLKWQEWNAARGEGE